MTPLNKIVCLLAVLPCLVLPLKAEKPATPPAPAIMTPSGRTVFFLDEEVIFHIPATKNETVEVVFEGPGKVRRTASPRARGGVASLTVSPGMFAEGGWTATAPGLPPFSFQISRPFANTPFAIVVYGGGIPGDNDNMFGGPGPMKVEDRIRLYRETYGINALMHLGHFGGPNNSVDADRAARIPARLIAQHVMAGQHQPGGQSTDWSDPAMRLALRYKARHNAQQWGRINGKTLMAIHYADEPGLTWAQQSESGEMRHAFPGEKNWYVGPFAVPTQHSEYERIFGKKPADWSQPGKDLEGWLHFMRWRTTILGDVFAELTQEVHAANPELKGYSQLYAWRTTSEGLYPPDNAKGIDILSTHGYSTWTFLGHMNPAHEVDAMRSGAWDKPLWMLGPWMGSQADGGGVRAVLYGVLARKVEGIAWPLDWKRTWPEAAEVSQKIIPLSGMLHDTSKPRDAVGLFHSRDQHLVVNSRNLRAENPGVEYHGRLLTAWAMAMAAGHPSTRVVEEDLVSGAARSHKVIFTTALTYVSDSTRKALEDYIAGGGVLLLDSASTVDIKGARKLGFEFKNGFDPTILPPISPVIPANSRKAFEVLVQPDLAAFKAELDKVVPPMVTCSNPEFVFGEHLAGGGRYLWIVNNANRRQDDTAFIPVDASAEITLPAAKGVIYDVFENRPVKERSFTLSLPKGDAKLYAYMPSEIRSVTAPTVDWKDGRLKVEAAVMGEKGPVDAIIPVSVTLKTPDGNVLWTVHRATRNGRFSETFDLGLSATPGRHTVEVTENITRRTASAPVGIKPSSSFVWRSSPVDNPDRNRVRAFLSKPRKLLVAWGDPQTKQAAERLAAQLKEKGVDARPVDAASFTEEVKPPIIGQYIPFFNQIFVYPMAIHEDMILIGHPGNNPLIERLTGRYGLAPWPLRTGEPGPGRALVWWSTAAFGLRNEAVTLMARDQEGLDAGIREILDLSSTSK